MEKQCKTDFFSVGDGKNDFGFLLVENPFFEQSFVGHHFVFHFFIGGQAADKF